jgi:hypothetical protein
MILTLIVIALALCAVGLFYMAVRRRWNQARQSVRPVDLKAFRTLMDRDDELFLRERLPRRQFWSLKRQRVGVTLRYVSRISGNAAVVMRMAAAAQASADQQVVQAASQVLEMATQIRTQSLVAMAKLSVEYAIPSLQLTPAALAPTYQNLRENVIRLGALQTQTAIPAAIAI